MKTILCDASPLIFLAKIDQLELIFEVLEGEVSVLQVIVDEICSESANEIELMRLRAFLKSVEIVDFSDSEYPSETLSKNDRSVLNFAIRNQVDWLVADERLLRRIAIENKIAVIGTFGILIGAVRKNLRTADEVQTMVDDLVGKHGCRISIALYQQIIKALEGD
ncbi:MAG: DUF3368 domain-containing protein [Verrucomicrobiales bacterium]|nr:DUF3368 domain-containing protein [Verrucomicrobiales bacterium]